MRMIRFSTRLTVGHHEATGLVNHQTRLRDEAVRLAPHPSFPIAEPEQLADLKVWPPDPRDENLWSNEILTESLTYFHSQRVCAPFAKFSLHILGADPRVRVVPRASAYVPYIRATYSLPQTTEELVDRSSTTSLRDQRTVDKSNMSCNVGDERI